MPLRFHRIGITARSGITHKESTIALVRRIARSLGATVLLDRMRCADSGRRTSCATFDRVEGMDLLIVIGGDGTILRTIRQMEDFSIPILSINRGTIGFMAELSLSETERFLPSLLRGEGVTEKRTLIDIVARRGRRRICAGHVLNEAVIAQGAIARLIDLHTHVNGEHLVTYNADGLIVATPTGSTAYSLAAGGPIVHPGLRATILTPINPHSFSQKPLVIPAEHTVKIIVAKRRSTFSDRSVSLTLDGQTYVTLAQGDVITARASKETVTFIRRKEDSFFHTLRTKLKWGQPTGEE